MGTILDGKIFAANLLIDLKKEIETLNFTPKLAVILIGNDFGSKIYVNTKKKRAKELGIDSISLEFDEQISQEELLNTIKKLNEDKSVNAILVQMPLPKHINAQLVKESIAPQKDVDGFHPYNVGKVATNSIPFAYSCTPKGIIKLLEDNKIEIEGKHVVIFGRSNIVGRPLSQMFLNKNATVTILHSKSKNKKEISQSGDIIVCAIGQAKYLKADYVKRNAIVIDVGINRTEENKIVGDVDFDALKEKTSYITPTPGGIGPITIAELMINTVELAKKQNS